jgi:hypothetical protein
VSARRSANYRVTALRRVVWAVLLSIGVSLGIGVLLQSQSGAAPGDLSNLAGLGIGDADPGSVPAAAATFRNQEGLLLTP